MAAKVTATGTGTATGTEIATATATAKREGRERPRKDIAVAIGTGPSRRTYLAHKMLRLKNAKVEICVRWGRLIASDSVGLHRESSVGKASV